jgi:DHA2 family multidrug resistance protein
VGPAASSALLNRIVDQQAYMLSADDIFYASAILFIGLTCLIWLARPAQGGAGGAAAASGAH